MVFFKCIFCCILFFIVFVKTDLGDFCVRILYLTILMKKSPKISYKFVCELCDYKCCKQSEYSKHLNTAKHKNLQILTKNLRPYLSVVVVRYTNIGQHYPHIGEYVYLSIQKTQYRTWMSQRQPKTRMPLKRLQL